jgi:N-acetylmuramoyl-L-alanine amidase
LKINHAITGIFVIVFSLSLSTFSFAQKGDGVHTVVIDAGHGGRDPGNLGTRRYKTKEKDIALAVSLKVGKYIEENYPDVKVVYTRKTDISVELEKRAEIANEAEADVFISIHCDSFTKSSVTGTTTIVLGKSHNDENMRVAIRENSVILLEENYEETYQGFDPRRPETLIALTLYQSAFLDQSISLAQKIQNQFRERVKRKDRGVKQQPLYVTSRTSMPAVLVELGFLTNPTEEDFLNSEKGQTYMASAIYRAFKEYKEERDAFAELTGAAPKKVPDPIVNQEKPKEVKAPIETPKPVEESNPESLPEVYYTVQIMTSALKKDLSAKNFKGLEGVTYYEDGGFYKYIFGKASSLKEVNDLKIKAKESGFKDAFVIALKEGNRIALDEARQLLQ